MYKCNIIYKGKEFNCSETAYQWQKATDLGQDTVAARILESQNGFQAKSIAKELNAKDVDLWKRNEGVRVMEDVLEAKFDYVADFQDELLKSGNVVLVEATLNRFWAAGLFEEKAAKCKPEYFPGQNFLGKLLMHLRNKYCSNNNDDNEDQKYQSLVLPNKEYYNISYVGLVVCSYIILLIFVTSFMHYNVN